jgi:hypothetical protein
MASKHLLQGLIKWSMRDRWVDRFEQIFSDHLLPACDETGIEADDIASTIGEDLFASTVWACAFEDFLTREFDGENAIDDYLKRRGWKETASVRTYMAALRNSAMSLYEVSEIVRDSSFLARDLLRGGEPVLINEQSATRSLKPWDRIAARVIQVGPRTQICGGVLPFEHETAEAFLEAWRGFGKLSKDEKRELAKDAIGEDVDDDAVADLSATEMLRASSSMFTTFWLIDLIDGIQDPAIPNLRNADGDELVLCEVCYPLAAGTTADDIQESLETCSEFRPTSANSWSWISLEKPTAASGDADAPESLTFETWDEDGALVLGNMDLKDGVLVLAANSPKRADTGRALLSEILEGLVGQPSVKTESVEQIMTSHRAAMPQEPDIAEEDRCAITHEYLDRHYRDVLDQPVPMLGGETPRAAVRTDSGRTKVAEWLKMMENRTAKSAGSNNTMGNYSFGWLWTELGISELRR